MSTEINIERRSGYFSLRGVDTVGQMSPPEGESGAAESSERQWRDYLPRVEEALAACLSRRPRRAAELIAYSPETPELIDGPDDPGSVAQRGPVRYRMQFAPLEAVGTLFVEVCFSAPPSRSERAELAREIERVLAEG